MYSIRLAAVFVFLSLKMTLMERETKELFSIVLMILKKLSVFTDPRNVPVTSQPYWLYRGRHTFPCEILASLSCLQLLTFIIVILVYFDFIHLPESFSPMLDTTPLISYLTGQIELL